MNKIPIYNAILSDENDGMICISLVDCPAVEDNFVAFNKQEEVKFSILNEEEKMILGVVMRADFPIYRYSENMGEYYIKYSKETIKEMTEKFLADNNQNKINLMHESGAYQDGVQLVQIFIKDEEKGLSPKGFEHIEDGSLFAQYHIENNEIWEKIKDGTFQGFSLEMYCTIEEDKNKFQKKKKNMTIERIKDVLRSLLVECGNVMSDKGNIFYEGDELIVGSMVYSDEDLTTPMEDGDYVTDEKVITIADGKVAEIKDKEVEDPEVEETVEEVVEETLEEEVVEEPTEEPETVDNGNAEIDELKAEIEALKAEIEGLRGTIESILEKVNAPMAEPIVEEFSKINQHVDWANIRKVAREWK